MKNQEWPLDTCRGGSKGGQAAPGPPLKTF